MLNWDDESPTKFHADGHTVHDFDKRFAAEDAGMFENRAFRWKLLEGA